MDREREKVRDEEQAAAAEAGRIGGKGGLEGVEESERASAEHGGGEAEGFEEAEQLLEEGASHGDLVANPLVADSEAEAEADPSTHGEADEPSCRSEVPAMGEERESHGEKPHRSLGNPARDPDPTEWPDPYDKRSDPRDPPDPDGEPFGAEPHPPSGATSTSDPHHGEDPEAGERDRGPEPEKLDE